MKVKELISKLQSIVEEHGDLDVYFDDTRDLREDEGEYTGPYVGYISWATGQIYSKYDKDNHAEHYPETEMFSDDDLVCVL